MIKLDIASFIFYYILCSVIIILVIWAIYGYRNIRRPLSREMEYIWKCSVCFNDYIDSIHEDISICPVCGSYNKRSKPK